MGEDILFGPSDIVRGGSSATFGVAPSGVDDGAVLQTAINALPNGGEIVLTGGTYNWTTTIPTVPPGLTQELKISGNGSKILLSTTARRFLDPGRTADGQVFKNITIENLIIDVNNVMSNDHVIFGTYKSTVNGNASPYNRCSFDRITLRNIRCINVPFLESGTLPSPFSAAVAGGRIIATLTPYVQDVSQESGATYSITNILFDRVTSDGCNGGLYCNATQMGGATGTSLPVTFDNIVFKDCEISMGTGALAATSSTGSNYQVGSYATGDRVRFTNCNAVNGTDTAYEVDGAMDCVFDICRSEEHRNDAFFIHNFNAPSDPLRQRTVFRDCVIKVATRVPIVASPSVGIGIGAGGSYSTGSVEVHGLHVETTTADNLTAAGQAFHIDGGTFRRLVLDGIDVSQLNTAGDSGGTVAPIWINPSGSGVVRLKDIYIRATGTAVIASGSGNYSGIRLSNSAGTLSFTIDGVQTDLQHIGPGKNITCHGIDLGRTSGSSMRGEIRRHTVITQSAAGGGSGAIRLSSNCAMNKLITITQCDFVAGGGVSGWLDIRFDDNATTSIQRVSTLMPRNSWSTANSSGVTASPWNFAITNPSVPASVTPYRNLSGFSETFLIAGGTITDISVSRSGTFPGGARTLATAAPAAGSPLSLTIEHGDYLQLTYSVAPTTYSKFSRPIS